jgi:hypothetical protein
MKRFSLLALASLVLSGSEVYADELKPSEKLASSIWASAVTADYITTYRLLKVGGRERAPHLAWLSDSPTKVVIVGSAIDAGSYLLFKRAFVDDTDNARARWFFRAALYSAAGFRAYLAVKNYKAYQSTIDRHAR